MLQAPNVRSSKAIYFFNWTDEKFVYSWNSEPYEFEPKQRMLFPEGIAYHFAKHLAEHTYNSKNTIYNLAQLEEQIEKGLIREGGVDGLSEEKMRIMAMNAKTAVVPEVKAEAPVVPPVEKPKKKGGRPKKVKVEEAVKSPDLAEFVGA